MPDVAVHTIKKAMAIVDFILRSSLKRGVQQMNLSLSRAEHATRATFFQHGFPKALGICREYVIEHLGDSSGILVLDETGFLKKGSHSVGVP
jgi:SRSO17 transposase